MKISERGKLMIKHHEGVKLRPYRCPAALWTIGVGHVLYPEQALLKMPERLAFPVKPEDAYPHTMDEVDALLAADLDRFERGVARLCPDSANNQGQFDALVSFAFNLGLGTLQRSTLRLAYNRGDIDIAAGYFDKYVRGGGKVLPGLVKRRADEKALFLSNVQE
jgi:lysozyme